MIEKTLNWYEKLYSKEKGIIVFSDLQIKNYINKTKRYLY